METREEIFDQDRGERAYYLKAEATDIILLPLTKDGFEALLEKVCFMRKVPVDDASRMVIAGYVHHIENEQDTTTMEVLGKILHKSVSNATTWRIDQEIKQKRNAEILAERDRLKDEETEDEGNVTSIIKPTIN